MRNNVMLGFLVAVLALSCCATLVLAGVNFIAQRQMETARHRTEMIKDTLNAAQGLANDAIAYSRENPAIAAVLTNFHAQARRLRTEPATGSMPGSTGEPAPPQPVQSPAPNDTP